MGLKFQGQLIARKEALLRGFFIQKMAKVNGVLISKGNCKKKSFVALLFIFYSQNKVCL